MIKIKHILIGLLIISSIPLVVTGQIAKKRGTTTAQFLKIGPGARAAAMGEAFSSIADDASALYWNPAGAAKLQNVAIFFSHINWLADIDYSFFAISSPVGYSSNVGFFVTNVTVPEEEVRTASQPDGTGERFDAGDVAIGISYARQVSGSFSFGIVGKYLQERIWSMSSSAVAIDIGTMYQSSWHNLRIGVTMSNFGTPMKLAGRANLIFADAHPFIDGNIESIRAELEMGKWDIPLNVKTSISANLIDERALKMIGAVDMVHPSDNLEYFNAGTELVFNGMFSLRAGMRGYAFEEAADDREGGFAFGGGINIPLSGMRFIADYAITDYGRLNDVQQFSLMMVF